MLDEVQRARNLLIAVKRAVDEDPARTPGRFVLTGSANLLMLEQVGETLAGRALSMSRSGLSHAANVSASAPAGVERTYRRAVHTMARCA